MSIAGGLVTGPGVESRRRQDLRIAQTFVADVELTRNPIVLYYEIYSYLYSQIVKLDGSTLFFWISNNI